MFVGIEFDEEPAGEISLVHIKWLTPRKSHTWWPPFKLQDAFVKSLKKGQSPNETWERFKIKKAYFKDGKSQIIQLFSY